MQHFANPTPHTAIVAKDTPGGAGPYLRLTDAGLATWIDDPRAATSFPNMREATRACVRLPGALRAYALPRDVECALEGVSIH
ncbi:MAG TPA: hypothetical protein VMT68_17790 [Caulobacteraceae bacterium]|nr:hypothetical protein [Caulobacteraceae bacterium]